MCNSFAARLNFTELVEAFARAGRPILRPGPEAAPNLPPLDEVRPTDAAPVVRGFGQGAELAELRFGFAPPRPRAGPVINFRSEGRRFGPGRALVPVSAFYEFTGERYPKTRWAFRAGPGLDQAPFLCLAALWRPGREGWPDSFSLLTAEPGPDVAPYHDRGVIPLPPARWAAWLDPDEADAARLLTPPAAGTLSVAEAPRGAPLAGG